MLGDASQQILEKYKRGIDDIISRYKSVDDSIDSIITINESGIQETAFIEQISFIKNQVQKPPQPAQGISLDDIHRRLFASCCFDDIVRFLS